MSLIWQRPVSSEYPKIWHTFYVSREKYLIQDLTESMFEEAIQFMKDHYFAEEPLISAYNLHQNAFSLDQYASMYRTDILKDKASLICFKEGSNEIVGLNMNYVRTTDEVEAGVRKDWLNSWSISQREWRSNSINYVTQNKQRCFAIVCLLQLGVPLKAPEILTSSGLCVAPKYRGRGIAVELLKARKPFCREFNIKLTTGTFTTESADRCAEKAGFKLEKRLSFDVIRKEYPHLKIPKNIKSKTITFRTMEIDED